MADDGPPRRGRGPAPGWTTPGEVTARIAAALDSGALLREESTTPGKFPWRLPLRGPSPRDLLEALPRTREWVAAWDRVAAGPGLSLEWKRLGGRAVGISEVPSALTIATLDDAARLARRSDVVTVFRASRSLLESRRPALLAWADAHPALAVRLASEPAPGAAERSALTALLAVVDWFEAHPASGLHLRQVDIPGIGTKFLEEHRGVLATMLDLAVPGAVVDAEATGLRGFARRYGLRDAEDVLVRIRLLDPTLAPWPGAVDLALGPAALAALPCLPRRVVVTENRVNFLTLPALAGTLALFGAGYGFSALQGVAWLRETPVLYWGDIDTHGFAILDQLRGNGIDARSLLMDLETLLAHRHQWVREDAPTAARLSRLDPEEAALYRELVENRYGERVRLEQERIGFTWVRERLVAATSGW